MPVNQNFTRAYMREGRRTFYNDEAFEEALTSGLAAQGIDLEAHFRQYNG